MTINIPLSVPKKSRRKYKKNYRLATHNTGNLFLFAADQKIEHLNKDFSAALNLGNSDPEHLFQIAKQAKIGVLAAHLGLIARYGQNYKKINYLVKLNGKSDIVTSKDPKSLSLWSIDDVLKLKSDSKLSIVGIGYTIYLGSEYENEMMAEAAKIIFQAQSHGLLTVLWIYPRGRNVKDEQSIEMLAGASGVGVCLGADFVKLSYPGDDSQSAAENFKEVVKAAGNTGIICSGGKKIDKNKLLKTIKQQITTAKTRGCAIGRNLHQHKLNEAIKLANDISKIVYGK